jgi:His/Glu/Gln/Arg/opine family amino acid ABC transporter permease subunit
MGARSRQPQGTGAPDGQLMALFFHYLSLPYLLQGIEVTLQVTGLGLLGGLMLGLILASMQLSRFAVAAALARGYSVIFRGTPLILQMVFVYDALPILGSSCRPFSRPASPLLRTKRPSFPKFFVPACSASIAARCWPARRLV